MAKRTRIIEGTWSCTSCDTRDIPARHRNCPSCNNPREETGQESEFDFGPTAAASGKSLREGVSDEKALDAAAAGVDWFCEYCGASNRGDSPRCRHCRAERSDASRTLSEESDDEAPPPPPAPKPSGGGRWRIFGAVLLALFGGCFAFSLWGSRTHEVSGEVTATEWKRTVYRESFQRVSRTGWREELRPTAARMPVDGRGEVAGVENIRDCTRRQRGTERVPDGTERVCRQKTRKVACGTEEKCTRKKMGNGFMKETCEDITKYCDESYEDCREETRYRTVPVYAQSCTYDTHEWTEVEHRDASGRDDAPRWPTLTASSSERLRREEKYTVRIQYEDDGRKEHVLEPKTEREFLAWKKGQKVPLQVSNLGKVQVMAADTVR